jgi:hypothetical protein
MNNHIARTKTALQIFSRRDFGAWSGLPRATPLADIARLFPLEDDWRGVGRLGSDLKETRYAYITIEGFEQQVRIWLNEDNNIILMDVEYPTLPFSLSSLLDRLGTPDAKLDSYFGMLFLQQSEWIYANRGLTLFINPENSALLRIAVYASSTLDEYVKSLRLNLKIRRMPTKKYPSADC